MLGLEGTLDPSERLAGTNILFDGDTGELRGFDAPTGQHTGSAITAWLIALHFGSLRGGGLPYRIFVCAMGLVVALLSASGVWIWWSKRGSRGDKREKGSARREANAPPLRPEHTGG